jgi:steroid 5-alpha reductase family enzyme
MDSPIALLLSAALLLAVCLMTLVWIVSRRIQNAGIVDIAWSAGFAPIALMYAVGAPGDVTRRALIAGMVVLWSLRLGWYLYVRVMGHHPVEDRRYAQLRAEWGERAESKMFWFFQLQAALLVALSVPFVLTAVNPQPGISLLEWLGVGLWLVGLTGESLADAQLQRFKADPANRGGVCRVGLWRYSRHPNYFFEWLIWVAYFLFAAASPWGWLTVYCPALMLYFLLRVTGIPMTEELAVKNKGEAYREYQRTTSSFVPWFPKPSLRPH